MNRWNAIFLVVGIGALGWLVYDTGPGAIASGLQRAGWGFLLACCAHGGALVVDAFAFRLCAGKAGRAVPLRVYLRAGLSGHALNQIIPSGVAGEFTKASILSTHLPEDRVAAAVVIDNLLMLLSSCTLIGVVAPAVALAAGLRGGLLYAFLAAAAVMLAVGVVVLWLLDRGTGDWPFRLLVRLRFHRAKVEQARAWWRRIEDLWRAGARDRKRMALAWVLFCASRALSVVELAVLLHFLGHEHVVPLAVLMLANTTVVAWLTAFIPMQAGSAEGGNYLLFRALALLPSEGVLLALLNKARRIVFVAIGLVLLGSHSLRQALAARAGPEPASAKPRASESAAPP